ncbi:MAG: hypothetical protein H0V19_01180 [Euzebyales bacterium]|nr:hypothetical protein [Euzebyales bacterium]MBA3620987.1 hypothetical protein [Euzebyales bacterium]
MAVHQCPRCELRFRGEAEVRAHLVDDHKVDPETLDRHFRLGRGVHPHRQAPDPTHKVHSDPHREDR